MGTIQRTVLPDFNATIQGEFTGSIWDLALGTPVWVPPAHAIWYPTKSLPILKGPEPANASALAYNPLTDSFVGTVSAVQNSSDLVYDPENGLVYSAESPRNEVAVIDPADSDLITTIPVGLYPTALALDTQSNLLFVANTESSSVTSINCTTDIVQNASIATGPSPRSVVFDPQTGTIFVGDSGDTYVWEIQPTTGSSQQYASLPGNPRDLAYSQSLETIGVTTSTSDKLVLLSPTLRSYDTVDIGTGGNAIATDSNGSEFIVGMETGSRLVVVNGSTEVEVDSDVPVGQNVTSLLLNPEDDSLFAWASISRNVTKVDLGTDTTIGSSPNLGVEPSSIAYDPSLNQAYVVNDYGGFVIVLNTTTGLSVSEPWWFGSPATSVGFSSSTSLLYVETTTGIDAASPNSGAVQFSTDTVGDGGALYVDDADSLLWFDSPTTGLTALGLSDLDVAMEFPLTEPNPNPVEQNTMAIVPSLGALFVVNETAHYVEEIDVAAEQIVDSSIDVGSGATALTYDPADDEIYVAGENLTIIDPENGQVLGPSIGLAPHAFATGIAFDSSRAALYVTTCLNNTTEWAGTLEVIDGSSLSDSYAGESVIPAGELPVDPLPLQLPGTVSPATDPIWVANVAAGTISVVATPPQVTFLEAAPSAIDVGQTTQILVGYAGGSGPVSVNYTGLPAGCSSQDTLTLNCTPTESATLTIGAVVTDALGLSAEANTTLTVGSALVAVVTSSTGGSPTIDTGQNVTLQANAYGGTPGYSFNWILGDGTTAMGPSVVHAYSSAGVYHVIVTATDVVGGSADATIVVQVDPPPVATLTVSPSNLTDELRPLTFSATVVGGTSPAFSEWTFGDATSAPGLNATHFWNNPGTYTVRFFYGDSSGRYANRTLSVVVAPILGGAFSSRPTPNGSESFNATIFGGTAPYNITWQFGDGSVGYGTNVVHAYGLAGQYVIDAAVVDAVGARINVTIHYTKIAASPSSSLGNFYSGIFIGLLVGATVALIALFLASRSRRRPPRTPSPYVPPANAISPEWKED